jgi:aldose 1-epimerase
MRRFLQTSTLILCLSFGVRALTFSAETHPQVTSQGTGQLAGGVEVTQFTLTNSAGLEVKVLTLGAMITSVKVPDRDGALDAVTLYREDPADYVKRGGVLGTVIGRFANRIAGARFTLDGEVYELAANPQGNHIHGGRTGFHTQVWDVVEVEQQDRSVGVRLSLTSPDGHEGYPGTLRVGVLYRLTDDNELWMDYTAKTDKPTHVNLTNHAYWNLKGEGDVLQHRLTLNADRYLPVDDTKIPLGRLAPVAGTVMDFTEPKTIGSRIEQVEGENYDHCYAVNQEPEKQLSFAARVEEPTTGRVMEVFTTQPGVQLYTARGMKFSRGERSFGSHPALCLETQHFPNAPNEPTFPTTVLRPGETLRETTMHRFSVR